MNAPERSNEVGSDSRDRPLEGRADPGASAKRPAAGEGDAGKNMRGNGTVAPSGKATNGAMKTRELPKANILLVDDRADKLMAIEAILSSLDQNIVKARSGKDALRCLLQQDFAAILLDVSM